MNSDATEILCQHCGYNLQGLHPGGRCPECGTSVAQSLRGTLLKHADPQWLHTVRRGVILKRWNIILVILLGILAGVVVSLGLPPEIQILVALGGGALGVWASFLITAQEPRISLREDTVTWRKAIRWCAVLGLAGSGCQQASNSSDWRLPLAVIGGLLSLTGVVAHFGELVYLRRFALRIPDDRLARSTRTVMWGTAICLAAMVLLGLVVAVLVFAGAAGPTGPATVTRGGVTMQVRPGGSATSALLPLAGGAVCLLLIPTLVFFLWYLRLLTRYKNAFTVAAAEAAP